jgi:hypothetical protein
VSPRWIRRIVVVVFVAGIAGMIVGSVADNNGIAITFGLITAAAAVGLILVTSVAPPHAFGRRRPGTDPPPAKVDEVLAADVEGRIGSLVDAGADERTVRQLVQRAVELGRGQHRARES